MRDDEGITDDNSDSKSSSAGNGPVLETKPLPASFRTYELVWCLLKTPFINLATGKTVDFWPCLIQERHTAIHSHMAQDGIEVHRVLPYYQVRPLGMLASHDEVYEESIVPYFLRAPIDTSRRDQGNGTPSLLKTSEAYLIGVSAATRISALYETRDRWNVILSSDAPSNDQDLTHQHFQSLWWGPELIWISDMLVLTAVRKQFPKPIQQSLLHMGRKSLNDSRGDSIVFLHVQAISKRHKGLPSVTGMLYEAANAEPKDPNTELCSTCMGFHCREQNSVLTKFLVSTNALLPPAPPDYEWLNISHGEITLPINLIGGRYYPHALDHWSHYGASARPTRCGERYNLAKELCKSTTTDHLQELAVVLSETTLT